MARPTRPNPTIPTVELPDAGSVKLRAPAGEAGCPNSGIAGGDVPPKRNHQSDRQFSRRLGEEVRHDRHLDAAFACGIDIDIVVTLQGGADDFQIRALLEKGPIDAIGHERHEPGRLPAAFDHLIMAPWLGLSFATTRATPSNAARVCGKTRFVRTTRGNSVIGGTVT